MGPGNLQTEEEEMEFPLHKRLCDIKSDLSYLFIVVWLALLQITASCAFSLWRPFAKTKPPFFTAMHYGYYSKNNYNAQTNLLDG